MRNSRGDLRGIPSRGKAGAPPVPARSRREKASEEGPSREQRRTVSGGAPHPNAAHQTSHLSLARTMGEAKIRYFLLVIASAWIFGFYAHASDKWDVSDN